MTSDFNSDSGNIILPDWIPIPTNIIAVYIMTGMSEKILPERPTET